MKATYLIPDTNESGLNGFLSRESLKSKSMEELLQMKKQKEIAIEEDKKSLLDKKHSARVNKRHEKFLKFDTEDLSYINFEIESRKQTAPAPAPIAPPATNPIVPAPVTPPATNPIVPEPVTPPAANPIVPEPVTPPNTSTQTGGGNSSTQTGENTHQDIGRSHLAPTNPIPPTTNNEEKSEFFTPTNILLVLLVVGVGIFFMTRKGK